MRRWGDLSVGVACLVSKASLGFVTISVRTTRLNISARATGEGSSCSVGRYETGEAVSTGRIGLLPAETSGTRWGRRRPEGDARVMLGDAKALLGDARVARVCLGDPNWE